MKRGDTIELREEIFRREKGERGTIVGRVPKTKYGFVEIEFGEEVAGVRRDLVQKVPLLQLKMERALR